MADIPGILAETTSGGAGVLVAAAVATAALGALLVWKAGAIAKTTFLQTIRQPIYTVLVLATFALLVFTLPLAGWTLSIDYHESDQRMLEDLGLGALRISGLLVAAFSASGVLRREIDDKTALIVMTKPVSRTTFILGKFAGVFAAVAAAYYLCTLVFLFTVRHKVMPAAGDTGDWPVLLIGGGAFLLVVALSMLGNLWFGWSFTSTGVWAALGLLTLAMLAIGLVNKQWHVVPLSQFGQGIRGQLILELAMMLLALMVLAALAIAVSTRLGQTMTLLVCAAVFILGSGHPLVFARWGDDLLLARVGGWFVPNFTQFYPQDDLTVGRLSMGLLGRSWLYGLLYAGGMLAAGVALFQTRELESSAGASSTPGPVGLLAWAMRIAAAVAGLAGLALPSLPQFRTLAGLAGAIGMAVGAAALWLLAGAFARGRRWSYWAVGALAAAALAGAAVMLLRGETGAIERPIRALAGAAVAAATLLVLILPNTRRHFQAAGSRQ
jgi:ABC-type transport system involved in multi-copper enzyme maturation permease subunit